MLNPLASQFRDLFERPRSFVFLVSHMRSYSSLLGHLLAETSRIDGYSELHRSYESELDLVRMAVDVQETMASPLEGDVLFDKILHRASKVSETILTRDDVAVIFSVRSPGATLASLVALGERDKSVKWAMNPVGALRHYTRRLDDIEAMAPLAGRAAVLIADDLLAAPRVTLDGLAAFLQLREPIPMVYSKHPRTGKKKFGDSSSQIHTGSLTVASDSAASRSAAALGVDEPIETTQLLPRAVLEAGLQRFESFLANPDINALERIGDAP